MDQAELLRSTAKIAIGGMEHSYAVQKVLLSAGLKWRSGLTSILHSSPPGIRIENGKMDTYTSSAKFIEDDDTPEVTSEEILDADVCLKMTQKDVENAVGRPVKIVAQTKAATGDLPMWENLPRKYRDEIKKTLDSYYTDELKQGQVYDRFVVTMRSFFMEIEDSLNGKSLLLK